MLAETPDMYLLIKVEAAPLLKKPGNDVGGSIEQVMCETRKFGYTISSCMVEVKTHDASTHINILLAGKETNLPPTPYPCSTSRSAFVSRLLGHGSAHTTPSGGYP